MNNYFIRGIFWGLVIVLATSCSKPEKHGLNSLALWKDTEGKIINAHGGGVMYHEGIYYWYGEYKGDSTYLLPNVEGWECWRADAGGVSCYSSTDLSRWKFEGIVLPNTPNDTTSDLHPSQVIERPKVIYNEHTKQFVMWMHIDTPKYDKAHAGVAVSSSPTGQFTYLGSFKPNGQDSRDQTLFKDDDGRAYHICSSEWNKTLYISLLNEDYTQVSGVYTRNFIGESREAPAVFKRNGKYYIITSGCTGWDPNQAEYAVADSLLGEWTTLGNPCAGEDADKTFYAQSTFVLPVAGEADRYIAMFDRWNKTGLIYSRYIWLPIQFEGEKIIINGEKTPKLIADTDEIVRFELISCVDTVLHRNTPDCQDIRYGFEGGRVVRVGNTYHWITAEMVGDPLWVNMRLGHWTSNNGIDWQRQGTIHTSDGDYTGTSQRAAVFGPMMVFVEEDNRWHLVYVCYKAKPDEPNTFWRNHDGIIQHAVSKAEGIDGIGGPYEDKNVLMRYDDHPDSWEGLQGTDSFFPYKIGNKWYAFYGSATTQDLANCQWSIGLAQADRIEGPWERMSKYNPVNLNGFAENPIVMQLENGVYIAIVDGGHGENKLGYTLSWDGINWSMLRYFKIEPAVKRWWLETRTPLSLIKENDSTYTLFFTAYKPYGNGKFGALSKLTFKVSFL